MRRNPERQTGSTLVITVLTACVVVMPLLMIVTQFSLFCVDRQRIQNVVEAAGLLLANDMSRIMINDQKFGYVSLSNHAPIGRATLAPDGEPLPVTGINTLVGTVRQNSLVARELRNQTMSSLVDADRAALASTISELNCTLSESLSGINYGDCVDIHGEVVDPIGDVTSFLNANLPKNVQLVSVRLTNGWLAGGSTTTISVPQPMRLAQVQDEEQQDGSYRAFLDIPVDHRSFSFAGVGSASSIVNSSEFQEADDEHICSIVKVECTVIRKDQMPFALNLPSKLEFVACCQPYAQPDSAIRGAMMLRFSGGPVAGLQSWRDFLNSGNFYDNQVSTFDVVGGDYPVDREARMRQLQPELQPTTSQQFAEHLYYWLRNGHARPRIDAIVRMISEPFPFGSNEVYVYEFADDGSISRRIMSGDRLPSGVTSDAQFSAVADTSVQGGIAPVIVFRDNVKHLGTKSGGKHGGQPLAGYPLSRHELQNYVSDEQLALRFGRRSVYRGGLALDIEIGGTKNSTACLDVESMRKLQQTRRI